MFVCMYKCNTCMFSFHNTNALVMQLIQSPERDQALLYHKLENL